MDRRSVISTALDSSIPHAQSLPAADTSGCSLEKPWMLHIVAQPEAYMEIVTGDKLKVALQVAGTAPMEYRWFKDTKELRYATSSTLEIPNVNQLDTGQYYCSVSNPHGSILSDPFQVKVLGRAAQKCKYVYSGVHEPAKQRWSICI